MHLLTHSFRSVVSIRGRIALGWAKFLLIPFVLQGADFRVVNYSVTKEGRLELVGTNAYKPLEIVAGSVVREARWIDPIPSGGFELKGAPRLKRVWGMETWGVQHGLPENEIRALCQTRDGYLWIGTPSGLTRFDGRRFVTFDEHNTPELLATRSDIRVLKEGSDGALWVGAQRGIVRFREGNWQKAGDLDPEKDGRVRDFSAPRDGAVWVASEKGLRRLVNGVIQTQGIPPRLLMREAGTVLEGDDGVVWVGNAEGLFRWNPRTGVLEQPWQTVAGQSLPSSILCDSKGVIWIGCAAVLRRVDGQTLTLVAPPEGDSPIGSYHPHRAAPHRSGGVWSSLGARYTLYGLENGEPEPVVTDSGSRVENVVAVVEDREGNLWCGTRGDGLIRLIPRRVGALVVAEPSQLRRVSSVVEDSLGRIWCGADEGVVVWGTEGAALFKFPNWGGSGAKVYSLAAGLRGELWASFVTWGAIGLGSEAAPVLVAPGRPLGRLGHSFGPIRAMHASKGGAFWLGTTNGVVRIQDSGDETWFGLEEAQGGIDVRALHEDREGTLWLGVKDRGLAALRNANQALPGALITLEDIRRRLPGKSVWSLHEDSRGVLWIGTDKGLARKDGDSVVGYSLPDPPWDGAIHQILEDDQGRFWIGGPRGIHRVNRAELDEWAQGSAKPLRAVAYSETEGMPNVQVSGESQPAGCRTRDGRLYFPTPRGLAVIDPAEIGWDPPPPQVHIEHVFVDGEMVVSDGEPGFSSARSKGPSGAASPGTGGNVMQFGPGRARDLRIRYTATSLTAPERVVFEHRLEGFETSWRRGGLDRIAVYTNLKPGAYRFRVRVADHRGTWNASGADWSFQLMPQFRETPYFWITIGLGVLVVASGFTLWRLGWQRRVLLLEQQVALNRERKRIARDMHDDLGAQLSTLSLQLSGASDGSARDSTEAQNKVREVIRHLNSLIWSVEPGNESVEALGDFLGSFVQEYLGRAGLRVNLELPDEPAGRSKLNPEVRRHVVAMVKEVLRNVVRHARAGTVRFRLEASGDRLSVEIADDGCGFDVSAAPVDRGLGHLRDRASEISGDCVVDSVPGVGTVVRISVPMERTVSGTRR